MGITTKYKKSIFIITFSLLSYFNPVMAQANQKCLTLGMETTSTAIDYQQISNALNKANICHKIHIFPAQRATTSLKQHLIDGEIGRVSSYADAINEPLVLVDWPIITGQGYLIVKDPKINSLAQMQGKTIARTRGRIWTKQILSKHKVSKTVNSDDQLIPLLLTDRIDGFLVDNFWWADYRDNYPQLKSIVVIEGSLYIWLLKKHASKAKLIKTALQTYIEEHGDFRLPSPKPKSN